MKKLIVLLLFSVNLYCQDDTPDRFEINGLWKFQMLVSAPFGDNALAKAHDPKIGFGIEVGLFKYSDFRLGLGYNIMQFGVSDKTMIGNIGYANYTSTYGVLSYEIPLINKISVSPSIGYGYAKFHYKGSSQSYGWQDGNDYRIGATANYNFTKYSSVYLGVHYIGTSLDIKTHPDYIDYFAKMRQLQFAIGIQFD